MADNVAVTPGSGATIATDDVGGVQYQRVKLDLGGDGSGSPLVRGQQTQANSLPVTLASDQDVLAVSNATLESLALAEDGAHVSGENGILALAVRSDSGALLAADGDRIPLSISGSGALRVATVAGSSVRGEAAHDAAATGSPVLLGGYASAAAPADVSADGDAARLWVLRNGAQTTVLTAAGALIGGDAANGLDVDVTRLPSLPAGTPVHLSPAEAARKNARNGRWVMNEYFNGWVFLGADDKPVMRNDRSRVGFFFRDVTRLAEELSAESVREDLLTKEMLPPEKNAGPAHAEAWRAHRRALAPLDSGFNKDWDPQVPRSRLADRTKLVKLLAYHYVQTTEPEEAVRRAVADVFGNPTYVNGPRTRLWVPGKYDAETVKSVADGLLSQVLREARAEDSVTDPHFSQSTSVPSPSRVVRGIPLERGGQGENILRVAAEEVKRMDFLRFRDALEQYAKGNGQSISIPLSSLDLSNVSASRDFNNKLGAEKSIPLPGEDGFTIGTITLKLIDKDRVIPVQGSIPTILTLS